MPRLLVALFALVVVVASSSARAAPCAGFTDVEDTSPFCPSVAWMKNRAITLGCTATTYCPTDFVSRLQMAALMNRLGERYLEKSQPIVVTESPRAWAPLPGLGVPAPATVDYLGAFTQATATTNTFLWSSLTAPNSVGGTSYRLLSVEYCIEQLEPGAQIDRVVLASNASLLVGLQIVSAPDTTLRTTAGCFSVTTNDGGMARSYGILVRFGGAGNDSAKKVILGAVRGTWVPSTGAADVIPSPGGSLLGD